MDFSRRVVESRTLFAILFPISDSCSLGKVLLGRGFEAALRQTGRVRQRPIGGGYSFKGEVSFAIYWSQA